MIKLSIVVPVFNCENFIERCLESIVPQLTEECELIIIDDNSKDRSREIINRKIKGKKKITLLINEVNKGVSESRNLGIKQSKGEYITFLDGDDWIGVTRFVMKSCDMLKFN